MKLRPCTPADVDALHALWTDPDVARYLWDGETIPRDTAAAAVAESEIWIVECDGEFAGFAGLRDHGDDVELLYGLWPRFWGRGLATEAARAVLGYGFEAGHERILIGTDEPNAASLRVIERLGATHLRDERTPLGISRYFEIRPTFDFDGHEYEKASAHQKEWGARLFDGLELTGEERVLDLGCGDGVLTAQLAARVGHVVGVDAAPGMIAAAEPRAGGNLEFRLLDIHRMEFDGEFDLVVSNAALHWVLDHEDLLARVHRSLRPGGAIRFNFAGDGNCGHLIDSLRACTALPEFARSFASFQWPWFLPTVDAYEALLAGSPFGGGEVWLENADRYLPDVATLTAWIDNPVIIPFAAGLDAETAARFRDAVVARMVEVTLQPDGTCFETFRRLNVSASAGRR